ncbi:MAG: transporter [Methanobrevibacter olleyae]|uniref:Transporter n=1 Tax=Methanobrevibacter olleyae TaxID=294671 RepID=A0A8T3VUQ4_METOL|nr:transporter [Methanobrevibacter olleyae]
MEILSALWQLGVFAAIILFGTKLGIASGLANLSKRNLALLCLGYGGGIMILSAIASLYASQMTEIINSYNSIIYLIMAVIMIFSGIYTIKEWKKHENNTMRTTRMILVAPCPCYFGSILASIIMAAPTIGLGAFSLSQYVAIAMVLVILIGYFASNVIVKFLKKPYPIVIGNFMLFLGIYFLLSSILIPNIIQAFNQSMRFLTIPSLSSLALTFLIAIGIVIMGIMISRRNDFLIKF